MKKAIIFVVSLLLAIPYANSQKNVEPVNAGVANFLNITPDARTAAMGGAGLAISTDGNAIFHSGATVFLQNESNVGVAYTYTPWMRKYESGYSLNAVGGFYKINSKHAVLAGFRYYNYPKAEITTIGQENEAAKSFRPGEMALDLGYAYQVIPDLAVSATFRYIRSDMGSVGDAKVGNAIAFDIGAVYKRGIDPLPGANWTVGVQLVNIGTKIKYLKTKESIPAAAKLGGSLNLPFLNIHQVMVVTDLSYRLAPSDVRTLGVSAGAEYTLMDHFMVRGGYHYGDKEKADFSYATAGLGAKYYGAQVDFSWLFAANDNPWRNTFRISVGYTF